MHDPHVLAWSIRSPVPRRKHYRERNAEHRWGVRRRRRKDNTPVHPWWRPAGWQTWIAGRCYGTRELVAIWHVEPRGLDALTECGPVMGNWRWHVHHWKVVVRPWQRFRARFIRCGECGRRMNTAMRVGYMGSDETYHRECMDMRHLRQRSEAADKFIAHLFHAYRTASGHGVEKAVEILSPAFGRPVHGSSDYNLIWNEHYRLRKNLGWEHNDKGDFVRQETRT